VVRAVRVGLEVRTRFYCRGSGKGYRAAGSGNWLISGEI